MPEEGQKRPYKPRLSQALSTSKWHLVLQWRWTQFAGLSIGSYMHMTRVSKPLNNLILDIAVSKLTADTTFRHQQQYRPMQSVG